jgi:hypothetical protein
MFRTLKQSGKWEGKGRWGRKNRAYRETPSCSVEAEVETVAVEMEVTAVRKLQPPRYGSRCEVTAAVAVATPGPGTAEERQGRRRGGVVELERHVAWEETGLRRR